MGRLRAIGCNQHLRAARPSPYPLPGVPGRGRKTHNASVRHLQFVAAITFGVALVIALQSYQFGHSNHNVYLLDAMRRLDPELLKNDWWTTQTLQYHAL